MLLRCALPVARQSVAHSFFIYEMGSKRLPHVALTEEALAEAKQNAWTVISMKNDWKVIFPFESK